MLTGKSKPEVAGHCHDQMVKKTISVCLASSATMREEIRGTEATQIEQTR